MSGICGFFGSGLDNDKTVIHKMLNMIRHRGVHEEIITLGKGNCIGILGDYNNKCGSIATSSDNRVVLVCCGQVDSVKKLAKEFLSDKHFQHASNIELLVDLYSKIGVKIFQYIDGQFTLAIFDKMERKLILARDPFGCAPLFYSEIDREVIFASEIKSILSYPNIIKSIDLMGLDQVLTFPGLISPRTMFENIKSCPPGHYIEIKDEHIKCCKYWDIEYNVDEKIEDINECIELVELALQESIKMHIENEHNVGCYLSGGLDSSLVTAITKEICQHEIKTVSATFTDSFFSEQAYQKTVREYLRIHDCINVEISIKDIQNYLERIIWHTETPLKESYDVASFMLSKAAKKAGLSVMMSGEGADELFFGYPSYIFDLFREKGNSQFDADEQDINLQLWGDGQFRYEKNHINLINFKKKMYSDKVLEQYTEFESTLKPVIDVLRVKNLNKLRRRSYIDFKIRLADHLLSDHGDRMMSANLMICKYPFISKKMIDIVSKIPTEYMMNGYEGKYIIKKIGEKYLPKSIVRREKFGFSAPGTPQLLQNNCDWVQDILSYNTIKKQGYFNPDFVEELVKKYQEPGFFINIPYEEDLLMPILTFGVFKETFNISDY